MIHSFIAHTSPGKSRVFALADGTPERLTAVTSLGPNDLHLVDELVTVLNDFLAARDEAKLEGVLEQLPNPVRISVRQFLADQCGPQLGAFNIYGPLEVVREAYFGHDDDDLEAYVSGAFTIGLGIRLTNERRADGRVGWAIQLRSDEAMLPAGVETRAWALPEGVKLVRTWVGEEAEANVAGEALAAAGAAAEDGRWVRAHTLFQSDDQNLEGAGGSVFVVDVFDAPIPLGVEDNTAAVSPQFA